MSDAVLSILCLVATLVLYYANKKLYRRFHKLPLMPLVFTPILLVLILVELSDVIFAVDSIPAIFAVTTDPFIVLTSNLFAILGLRAMYFLLAGVAERFSMLKYGLSVILVFIGVKMLIVDFYHIPVAISLGVVGGILTVTLLINAWVNRQHDKQRKLPE